MKLKTILFFTLILLFVSSVQAATLKGSVYNEQLTVEDNVLIEIDTVPTQKTLAVDGSYSFELPPGTYTIVAQKGLTEVAEEVTIVDDGTFVYDLFLLPGFADENALWDETNEDYFEVLEEKPSYWRYWVAAVILIFALYRVYKARKKYGPLNKFRKEVKKEQLKTVEEMKEEIANEPGELDKVLEIIKNNNGRILQKELRKEMLPLSEAKVSLIVSELEHKGKVVKFKKGRGNIILLKQDNE